ncbi:hypothetical protein VTH06DRAFT_2279 [Thermothelomyces fergusii]
MQVAKCQKRRESWPLPVEHSYFVSLLPTRGFRSLFSLSDSLSPPDFLTSRARHLSSGHEEDCHARLPIRPIGPSSFLRAQLSCVCVCACVCCSPGLPATQLGPIDSRIANCCIHSVNSTQFDVSRHSHRHSSIPHSLNLN